MRSTRPPGFMGAPKSFPSSAAGADQLAGVHVAAHDVGHVPGVTLRADEVVPDFVGEFEAEFFLAFIHVVHGEHEGLGREIGMGAVAIMALNYGNNRFVRIRSRKSSRNV